MVKTATLLLQTTNKKTTSITLWPIEQHCFDDVGYLLITSFLKCDFSCSYAAVVMISTEFEFCILSLQLSDP